MDNAITLIVSLSKVVDDVETGQQLFDLINNKLQEYPDIKVSGRITQSLELTERTE